MSTQGPNVWGFKSKHKAEILSRHAGKLLDTRNGGTQYTGLEVIFARVGEDGLPAQEENDDGDMQAGFGSCIELQTGPNGLLTPAINSVEVFNFTDREFEEDEVIKCCLLYTSPSPRDVEESRMPSSA